MTHALPARAKRKVHPLYRSGRCWVAWFCVTLLAACGGQHNSDIGGPSLSVISVTPTVLSVAAGVTDQLGATAVFSDGSKQDVTRTVTWISSNPLVATVSASGLVTTVNPGSATISAILSGLSGTARLTVTAATLVGIGVTPAMPSLAAGGTEQFTATGVYTDNSKHDVTTLVSWTSSDTAVASVSNSIGVNGLATAVAPGRTSVTATLNGISSPTVTLTVTAATLVSIAVTPAAPSIPAGTTEQLTATGTYTDHSTQDLTTEAQWSSSNSAVASIGNASGSTGLVTTISSGSTLVTATFGGITSPVVTLVVTPAILVSIEVTPATASVSAGTTQQFIATGTYSDQSTRDLTASATWTSSNTVIAAISNTSTSSGLATTLQTGQVDITAQLGSVISPSATLTVTQAILVSIAVTPATPSVMIGNTLGLMAVGTYTDSSTQNLTTAATWSSSDTSVATISNANGSNGEVTPITGGTTQITASLGTVVSPAVNLQTIVPTESVLYAFSGGIDGSNPFGSVILGSDGNFYGTTAGGGSNYAGTVFKLTPSGVETVLYSFGASNDGSSPADAPLQASDGNFYGTTDFGGTNGAGTVFKVTSDGTETIVYSFGGGNDGTNPYGSLIQGSDGNFYGMTQAGGATGNGTVFMVTPAGAETVLYSFAGGSDCTSPYTSLIQGSDGNLYGTCPTGGASGYGMVFKLTSGGVETVLYSFSGGTDGASPSSALVPGNDGNFYGITSNGGANNDGVVFQITPAGVETPLYSFSGGNDGANPDALLLGNDGNLYGTTAFGGSNGDGTLFRVTSAGVETVLYTFLGGNDGATPAGLLQRSDGTFFGTTYAGGFSGSGTVFKY